MSTPASHPAELPSDSAPTAKPKIDHVEFWAGDQLVSQINLIDGLFAVVGGDEDAPSGIEQSRRLRSAPWKGCEYERPS